MSDRGPQQGHRRETGVRTSTNRLTEEFGNEEGIGLGCVYTISKEVVMTQ